MMIGMFFNMQQDRCILSLGQWPQQLPEPNNTILTPITKRILSQVHVSAKDILPLSYQQYVLQGKIKTEDQSTRQRYQFQVQRRRRQVQILSQIRHKYIMGNDYGYSIKQQSKLALNSRIKKNKGIQSRQIIKRLASPGTASRVKTERNDKSSKMSRTKHSESDYLGVYSADIAKLKDKGIRRKKSQETVRSRQLSRAKKQSHPGHHCAGDDYQTMPVQASRKLQHSRKNFPTSLSAMQSGRSKEMVRDLLRTIKRWQTLDRAHLQELGRMRDISMRERDRLSRLHSNEKKEMRVHIKQIKSRLMSQHS